VGCGITSSLPALLGYRRNKTTAKGTAGRWTNLSPGDLLGCINNVLQVFSLSRACWQGEFYHLPPKRHFLFVFKIGVKKKSRANIKQNLILNEANKVQ
jgi:hypothetical protein